MFLLLKGELENRFDATAYKKAFIFKSNIFPIRKLSDLAFINPNTSFDKLDKDSYISFVPMEVIDEKSGTITESQTKKVSETKGFTKFKDNDLIWAKITPCMQNGKSTIVRNTLQGYACSSTEFFIIRPKSSNILIEYIHFLLRDRRVLENAQNYFGGSAGQQRVSREFIENFKTPLPPIEIQQKIIHVVEKAYELKKANEEKAKTLLAGIDDYLLAELGIVLPEKVENTLKNRVFLRKFNGVSGGRFDSYFYQEYFEKLELTLKKGKFPIVKVSQKAVKITSGATPLSGGNDYTTQELGVPFIRSGEINELNEIDFENCLYIKREVHEKMLKSSQLKFNDTLIAIVGATIGQVAIYESDKEANINQALALVRFGEDVVPEFFKSFLFYSVGKGVLDRLKRPVARANINLDEIGTITFPLPPLEIQEKIVAEITNIRQQAKTLQNEAKTAIEKAKRTVEAMILGD